MIDKKYIYLGSVFLLLIIIKFINPPIIQKISFINYDFYQKVFTFRSRMLEFMGKHALIIYLSHQIVLFGLVAFVYFLLN